MKNATFYIGDKPAILAEQDGDWYLVELDGAFDLAGVYKHTVKLVMKLSEITNKLNQMVEDGELRPVFLMTMNNYGIVAMNDKVCYRTYSDYVNYGYELAHALMRGEVLQDNS